MGTYIFICAIYDAFLRPSPPFNKLTKHPVLSFCFGLVNILHALAVFYNHASGTNTGGKLDQSFMRGVILFPLIFSIYILFPNIHARRKISTAIPFSLVYMASVVLFLVESFNRIPYFAFAFFAPLMGLDLLGAFFLCFYFDGRPCRPTPRTQPMHLKFVISTLIFLLIGLGIWYLLSFPNNLSYKTVSHPDDRYPEYMFSICIAGTTPYTFIQAHGLWHFFTAIAILCSYFFMRSANRESAIDAILTNSCVESDHGHEVEMSTVSVSPTLGAPQESLEDRPRDDCT